MWLLLKILMSKTDIFANKNTFAIFRQLILFLSRNLCCSFPGIQQIAR